jgi:hypothetical protein
MTPPTITERLTADIEQLNRMVDAASFAGEETAVRVKAPDILVKDLSDALEEIARLTANINRLTANPADHRYWEGRFRDEEKARLAADSKLAAAHDVLKPFADFAEKKTYVLDDFNVTAGSPFAKKANHDGRLPSRRSHHRSGRASRGCEVGNGAGSRCCARPTYSDRAS